jgi:hypothetical protein
MGDQMLFETACKQGRLAITRDRVALQRGRAGRGRATWTLPRSTVSGMSSQLAGSRYELTIHTQGGRRFTLDGVAPVDTLKSVALLGYVQSSERQWHPGPALPATYRCKGGQLELAAEHIAWRPRFFKRRHAWSLAREEVTGVSLRRLCSMGLLHDLVIYTRTGAAHTVERVPAPDALTLTRALGFAPQSPPVGVGHSPVQPRPMVVSQPQPRPRPALATRLASALHTRVPQVTVGALWRAYGW